MTLHDDGMSFKTINTNGTKATRRTKRVEATEEPNFWNRIVNYVNGASLPVVPPRRATMHQSPEEIADDRETKYESERGTVKYWDEPDMDHFEQQNALKEFYEIDYKSTRGALFGRRWLILNVIF